MKRSRFLILILFIACQGQNQKDTENPIKYEDTIVLREIDTLKIKSSEEEKLKVLVIPSYDKIANRGISPNIRVYLQNELSKSEEIHLIDFPFRKLMNVPYQNVYDKKYCQPIIERVNCDIIVMSKLDFVKQTGQMPRDGWNLRIRLYNVNSGIQIDSELKVDSLSEPGIKKVLGLTQDIIIKEIKSTVTNKW